MRRGGITFTVSSSPLPSPPPSPVLSSSFPSSVPLEYGLPGLSPKLWERILEVVLECLYVILKPFIYVLYYKAVERTNQHWEYSTKVNLKLDDLTKTLKEHGIGAGSVILYSAEGNNWKGLLRYMIKGRTNSRYSHVMMLIPHPNKSDSLAVWQSALPHPMKLGGGDTNSGPDVCDLEQVISVFSKRYQKSRFVFRRLTAPLSPSQQLRIHDSVKKVMDNNIYYPMNFKIYWAWVLSNNPELASWAYSMGIDCGVKEDKYESMYCSMLITHTLMEIGVLDAKTTKAPQYCPSDYGLPQNTVPVFGDELEFVFDDLQW